MTPFNPEDPDEQPNLVPPDVVVSVRIVTYNHAPFIAQAIESVLMQETSFPFELLIGEDDSTDQTREICKEYAERYPETIRLFLRHDKDKIYIEGRKTGKANARKTRNACRGKYVAWLEGDDYWTDKTKLQQQVEIMEKDATYSAIYHRVSVVDLDGRPTGTLKGPAIQGDRDSSLAETIQPGAMHLSAILVRRSLVANGMPDWATKARHGDFAWAIFLSGSGKVHFLDKIMSSYRTGVPGSLMTLYRESATTEQRIAYLESRNQTLREAGDHFGGDTWNEVQRVIRGTKVRILLLQGRYLNVFGKEFKGIPKRKAIYGVLVESLIVKAPCLTKFVIKTKHTLKRFMRPGHTARKPRE